MEYLFIVLLIAVVLIGVMSMSKRRSAGSDYRPSRGAAPRRPMRSVGGGAHFRSRPPGGLGVRPGHPAEAAARRLEEALDEGFAARVMERVRQSHPSLNEGERDWALFELKRFFLMTAVLRGVNMYSSRVDDVWHEMLMFTREYEDFCKRLTGAAIHHAPHGAAEAAESPAARPWFDWVYGELFVIYPESERLWGPFFRRPLPAELIAELERGNEGELMDAMFHAGAADRFADLRETAETLIRQAKRQIAEGHARMDGDRGNGAFGRSGLDPGGIALMSGALMFASMSGPDDFDRQMEELSPERKEGPAGDGGGGYYGGDYGSDDDRGDGPDSDYDGGPGGESGGDSGDSGGGDGSGGMSGGGDSGGSSCGSSCGGGGCGGGS